MKLYAPLGNFRANKILVTSEILNLPIIQNYVDMKTLKEKDFLKKNPLGKIPVLESADGFIFESNAILRYLARTKKEAGLYGENEFQAGLVDQWLDFSSMELEPAILQLLFPVQGWIQFCKEKSKRAWHDTTSCLKILDNHLKINNYMVGSKLTIADIALVSVLANAFRWLFEEKYRKSIPNVTRWFESIVDTPAFLKVWGKIRLCIKEFEPFVHHHEKHHHEGEHTKEEHKGSPKKKEKKKEEKKPAEKPAAKPKKEEAEDDDEEKPVKKEKNPLDCLPPSKFNLFDFKTLYVNAPNKHDALKFFWENFDNEGYSIWFVKYIKVKGEGEKLFLTNNLMNGFLQRLESFRKYAFAVHGVYGEEPNLEIRGVWVWRGVEHPNELKEVPAYEYHTYERLNPSNEEHRKTVEQFWTGLEEGQIVDGLVAQTPKYFK